MFSRYKKEGAAPTAAPRPKPAVPPRPTGGAAVAVQQPVREQPQHRAPVSDEAPRPAPAAGSMRKPMPKSAAIPMAADKNRKRKERLGEIKLELHRALLDNLNLAALDNASEQELRMEINSIATEVLQEKGIVHPTFPNLWI